MRSLLSLLTVSDIDNRKARASASNYLSRNVAPETLLCRYPKCIPPANQNSKAPLTARPDYAVMWSNIDTWPNKVLPADGEDVDVTISKTIVFCLVQLHNICKYLFFYKFFAVRPCGSLRLGW